MVGDRSAILTGLTVLAGTAAAFFGFAWPHYRTAGAINGEIAHLERRIATSDEQHVSLDALASRLSDAKSRYASSLREIPGAPDMAGLMRALTLDQSGNRDIEQTMTFGRPGPDPAVNDGSINILPLTVDMTSRFDPVFEVIATAEGLARLVRVASVLIERSKESPELLDATVRLEAVYEGTPAEEEVE